MSIKAIEAIKDRHLKSIKAGNKEAVTPYRDLMVCYNAWEHDKSADNWRNLVHQAQVAIMWIPRDENSN
jgi:hypothetical protein